jgi:HK97 family phage major capsid protein
MKSHRACEKSLGRTTGGFIVPWQVLERRGLTKVSSSAGGYLVGTDHLGGSFIEILRNKMLIQLLGATVLSGLVGDVVIPRQDSPTAAYWVTEGNSPTEGAPTFGQVTMSPKTVAGYVDITRKLALQSSPSIEYLIKVI